MRPNLSVSRFMPPMAFGIALLAAAAADAQDAPPPTPIDQQSVPALIGRANDPSVQVRRSVSNALKEISQERGRRTARALSQIGGDEAVAALRGLLYDSDPQIRKYAADAMGKP